MDVVKSLADRIVVLHNGRLVADGEPAEVIGSPSCRRPIWASPRSPSREAAAWLSALLTLEGVHTHIGQYHILQGVDFVVPRGGMTVLLGRNGAGKTTTLRTIMGLWKPSRGKVDVRRPRDRRPRDARHRARRHRLRAGDHGRVRRPHGAARTWCWPPRTGRRTPRGSTGSSASSRR